MGLDLCDRGYLMNSLDIVYMEFTIVWCPSVSSRRSFLTGIESVIEDCESDFVPYDGFYDESGCVDMEFFENYLDASEDVLVAIDSSGCVVGWGSFEAGCSREDVPVVEDSFGYFSLVMVESSYRGMGVGTEITRRVLELLRVVYDEDVVYLSTWESNEGQLELLARFGFSEVARKEGHRVTGEDTVYVGVEVGDECYSDI